MAKKLATSTQLKYALAKIEELEKNLAEEIKSKDRYYRAEQEKTVELEQLQCVLDALPNCIPRKAEGEYYERKPLVRFAAWLGTSRIQEKL